MTCVTSSSTMDAWRCSQPWASLVPSWPLARMRFSSSAKKLSWTEDLFIKMGNTTPERCSIFRGSLLFSLDRDCDAVWSRRSHLVQLLYSQMGQSVCLPVHRPAGTAALLSVRASCPALVGQ